MRELVILLQPLGDLQSGDLWQLDVHQNKVGAVLARQGQSLQAFTGLQSLIALGVKKIMK